MAESAYLGTWRKYTPEPEVPRDCDLDKIPKERAVAIASLMDALRPLGQKIGNAVKQCDPEAYYRIRR